MLKKILKVLAVIIVVLALGAYGIWRDEIHTLASIEKIQSRDDSHKDGSVYKMHVKGGFNLDEFVKQGGAKNDKELLKFMAKNITKGIIDMKISESEISCSSFTAKDKKGDMLFGRNYDFEKTNTCIVKTDGGNGRHATYSSVDLQFLGLNTNKDVKSLKDKALCLAAPYAPLDGINDAGLSCGIYMTYQGKKTVATDQNTSKPDFTSTTMLRLMLDYASNVDEAVKIAKKYDLHDSAKTSYHYMVADASGKSAILEWVNGTDATDNDGSKRKLKVTYKNLSKTSKLKKNNSSQIITNFIIEPGYYKNNSEKQGYDRFSLIQKILNKKNSIVDDEKDAMDVLARVGRRKWKNEDKNSCTVHSVVFNLSKKTMMWIPNEHYNDEKYLFKFSFDSNSNNH